MNANSSKTSLELALFGGARMRTEPFVQWPVFGPAEEERLLEALRSGLWGKLHGPQVAEFEGRFAAMHACKHAIGVVNGTVSLRIALIAAGLEAGDEVIVPPYTFLATATAVVEANAVPVFADIELETFNLSLEAARAAVTPRTKAIIPVHMAGQPADMEGFMALAREHNLVVIEDAAHAHAALHNGRPAGSLAHIGSFSFQSSKNLTCGEGGIITTNDAQLAAACRSIHNCGRVEGGVWYEHHVMSANYRLGEFQGAVLNAQLQRLEEQTIRRDRNGQALAERLRRIPGIHPQKRTAQTSRHSYHLFLFRILQREFGASRQAVLKALAAEGIPVSAGYAMPLYRQPLFMNKAFGPYLGHIARGLNYGTVCCPNAELICGQQGAWLEQNLLLGSEQDVEDIARAFEKVYRHRAQLSA